MVTALARGCPASVPRHSTLSSRPPPLGRRRPITALHVNSLPHGPLPLPSHHHPALACRCTTLHLWSAWALCALGKTIVAMPFIALRRAGYADLMHVSSASAGHGPHWLCQLHRAKVHSLATDRVLIASRPLVSPLPASEHPTASVFAVKSRPW